MKNRAAKNLMVNACVLVRDNGEVAWLNLISINGRLKDRMAVTTHSEYLGDLDDCKFKLSGKCKSLNIRKKDMTTVY